MYLARHTEEECDGDGDGDGDKGIQMLCESPKVVAACRKDYMKEKTWIETREDPPRHNLVGGWTG